MRKRQKISAWLCAILLLSTVCVTGVLTVRTAFAEPEDENPTGEVTEPEQPTDPVPDPEPAPAPDPIPEPDPEPDPVAPGPNLNPTPEPTQKPIVDINQTPATEGEDETESVALPEDVLLSELSISCGAIYPMFSPTVLEYTVYVTRDQEPKDATVTALAANANASIEVDGPSTWDTKDIQRTVTVTMANLSATYTINVHVLKATELFWDNSLYMISDEPDLNELPAGFEKVQTTFGGEKTVTVVRSPDGSLVLTQFVNGEGAKLWYRVDIKNASFVPMQLTQKDGKVYVVVASGTNLLYGSDGTENGYYAYNERTGELEFFVNPTGSQELPKPEKTTSPLMIAALAVAGVSLIVCIAVLARYTKWKKSFDRNKYFRPYISVPENEEHRH